MTLEVPAGKLDADGEDPLHCARRELSEETGYTAKTYEKLTTIATTVGFSNEYIHLYAARGLSSGMQHTDADEFVNVAQMPFSRALEMIFMFGFNFTEMLLGIPGLIIAMTFHEYAHARAAVSLGDFTPRLMGRLTIDPRAHIDPIGLIMLFLVRFGWAKPVMINPVNFRNPKRDDIIVSLAGPAMNLLLGFIAFYSLSQHRRLGDYLQHHTDDLHL